ncbi:polysulfide reductase NrfD [Slackia exigua]|uniref:NrfD/PsrC family molybdoenzyme membrane anchor subunit n=1 Tax=Slackia exigua TaxID=84109 RepID=UPI003BA0A18C
MLTDLSIAYLFLGGTGGGALVACSLLSLLTPRSAVSARRLAPNGRTVTLVMLVPQSYRLLLGGGFGIALACLFIGSLALLTDLGRPVLATMLFVSHRLTLLNFGTYALAAGTLMALLLACAWGVSSALWRFRFVRALGVVGIVCGLSIALYTGLLLGSLAAVPLWSSIWLPVLFVLSSLSCGLALLVIYACMTEVFDVFATTLHRLLVSDAVVIMFEALAAAALLACAFLSEYDVARQGAKSLVGGPDAAVFIGGFVLCGVVVPLVLDAGSMLVQGNRQARIIVTGAFVLVGGFALRYSLVMAGAHPFLGAL